MKITTQYRTDGNGKGKVTAKAMGKQRTVVYDHSSTPDVNHARAAGVFLNDFGTDEEKAKMMHPSARQRYRIIDLGDGKKVHTLDL
jgi:hypothetical protein